MADMDGDGDMDLFVGDANGNVTYYSRGDEGNLTNGGLVTVDDEEISVGRAAPHVTDWDQDGDFDLLVGMFSGSITLYENTGSAEEFVFTNQGLIQADGEHIWVGADAAPAFADLDGDGKRDLIVGCTWGELYFFPNVGEDDNPEFGQYIFLEDEDDVIRLAGYSRIEVVDWEGDGDLDILSGLIHPELRLWLNPAENHVSPSDESHPRAFQIVATYPEPFNSSLNIVFNNDRIGSGTLDMYDLSGRHILHKHLGILTQGSNVISVDFNYFPSSRYLIKLSTSEQSVSRVVTLVK